MSLLENACPERIQAYLVTYVMPDGGRGGGRVRYQGRSVKLAISSISTSIKYGALPPFPLF